MQLSPDSGTHSIIIIKVIIIIIIVMISGRNWILSYGWIERETLYFSILPSLPTLCRSSTLPFALLDLRSSGRPTSTEVEGGLLIVLGLLEHDRLEGTDDGRLGRVGDRAGHSGHLVGVIAVVGRVSVVSIPRVAVAWILTVGVVAAILAPGPPTVRVGAVYVVAAAAVLLAAVSAVFGGQTNHPILWEGQVLGREKDARVASGVRARVRFGRVPGLAMPIMAAGFTVERVGAVDRVMMVATESTKRLGRGILFGHPVLRQGQILIEEGAHIPKGFLVDI